MRYAMILVGSLLLIPAIVQAQGRGGGAGMAAHSMVAAPHAMAHAAAGAPVAHVSSGTRIPSRSTLSRVRMADGSVRLVRRPRTNSPGTTHSQFAMDSSSAPGLGFDETHFRAVHPRRANRVRNRNDFGAFFPFFDGGFFLPSSPIVGDDIPADGQQEEYADSDPQDPPQHLRTHIREQSDAPVISRDVIPEPPVKTDEYVFVRRDGTLFFAIAYAWENGTLRYVTIEGFRRSAARDSLDLDATQQFNEQRGMSFRVPA